jgi:hypothetical protein
MVPQTRRAIIQAFDALIAATPFEDITKANRNGEVLLGGGSVTHPLRLQP